MRATVGPLAPEVYWRRRLLMVGLLVLALVGLRACAGGDTSRAVNTAQPKSTTPNGTPTHPYVPQASASPTGSPTARPTTSPVPSPTPGASGSPRAAAIGLCADANLELTVASDARTYASTAGKATAAKATATPKLTITVKVVSGPACHRDLGSTAREVVVTSGADRIWSGADCQPAGHAEVALLQPGVAQSYTLTWSGKRSQPCAGGQSAATPGTYRVQARLGTLYSNKGVITLT